MSFYKNYKGGERFVIDCLPHTFEGLAQEGIEWLGKTADIGRDASDGKRRNVLETATRIGRVGRFVQQVAVVNVLRDALQEREWFTKCCWHCYFTQLLLKFINYTTLKPYLLNQNLKLNIFNYNFIQILLIVLLNQYFLLKFGYCHLTY